MSLSCKRLVGVYSTQSYSYVTFKANKLLFYSLRTQCCNYSIMTRLKWRHGLIGQQHSAAENNPQQKPTSLRKNRGGMSNLVNDNSKNVSSNERLVIRKAEPAKQQYEQPQLEKAASLSSDIKKTQLFNLTKHVTETGRVSESELAILRLPQVKKTFPQPELPRLLRVAVIGRPNAGKSTLINGLVGQLVSDVAARAHTTRGRINAILTEQDTQLVFLDTPGVAKLSGDRIGRSVSRELQTASWRSLDAADHIMLIVDAKRAADSLIRGQGIEKRRAKENKLAAATATAMKIAAPVNTPSAQDILNKKFQYFDEDDNTILRQLQKSSLPVTIVFNKLDLLSNSMLILDQLKALYSKALSTIHTVIFASALGGNALDDIKFNLLAAATPKPWMFPANCTTDTSDVVRVERAVSAELYEHLRSYMAYAIRLKTVSWSEQPLEKHIYTSGIVAHIQILVEHESQKRMVIGSQGLLIKSVKNTAEAKLAESLRKMVRLHLDVKLV
ncbi:P-loop containing nucleoside triphosphate hydrolase protein [Syncephalis fuscata]|nr:P-loop containing nucleoside triphosphate hydrolase protein [Syncephalis fuscata]